jgi:hypothetical protein
MLLRRNFTGMLIPVNYAAWGVPNRKVCCRRFTTGDRGTGFPYKYPRRFFWIGVWTLNLVFLDLNIILAMAAAAVVAIAMIGYAFHRPSETSEALERKRRLHLNQIGRIAEGQIVEFGQHPPEPPAKPKTFFGFGAQPLPDNQLRQLVSYSYAISGVTYHTAQDITGLEGQIRFERLVAGQPASVKYDPSNPSDSILVADDWSGLR